MSRAGAAGNRRRIRLSADTRLLALALAGGCVDAISYVGLGKVFTANMTGNTVLLAVALVEGRGADAARSAVALGGFCIGVGAGLALIATSQVPWPRRARAALTLELVALLGLLVLWTAIGVPPIRYGLIALAGLAMGIQSAAVRVSDERGVNTTYMTGTLVSAIARLTERIRGRPQPPEPGPSLPGAAWLTYGIGALIGVLTVRSWHAGSVAVALVIVGMVAAPIRSRQISAGQAASRK